MKTIITTDIHGCALELTALLRKAALDRTKDRLVILGDLFDRGRHSYAVYRTVRKLAAEMGERFILVRGNHDQFLLDYLNNPAALELWRVNGGLRTLASFELHHQPLEEVGRFLSRTPLWFETDRFIAVHAGLVSEIPSDNDPDILLWDRSVTGGSYRGKLGIGGHTPMNAPCLFTEDGHALVLGEDVRMTLPERGFICLDTGCVFGRRLTAMIIEDDVFRLASMKKMDY